MQAAIDLLSNRIKDVNLASLTHLEEEVGKEVQQLAEDLDEQQSKRLNERQRLEGALQQAYLLKEMTARNQVTEKYFQETEEVALTRAFRNVSHVLQYMRFLREVPQTLKDTEDMLDDVLVGTGRKGNADSLYEAHGNICALERLRNLTLMSASKADKWSKETRSMFRDLDTLRSRMESIVFEEVFANLHNVAKSDPRILVATIRLVAADEKEDKWWERQAMQSSVAGSSRKKRHFAPRCYRSRCLQTIKESIAGRFQVPAEDVPTECVTDDLNSTDKAVERILSYADSKLQDLALVQQYVVPCFPDDYEIGNLFISEYYGHIMVLISKEIARKDKPPLSRLGRHSIVRWYSRYKAHLAHIGIISAHDEEIFTKCDCCAFPALPSIPYAHSSSMLSCVSFAHTGSDIQGSGLEGFNSGLNSTVDGTPDKVHLECEKWADYVVDYLRETLSRRILALIRSDTVTHGGKLTSIEVPSDKCRQRSTQLPEALFSTVESEVRDVTLLCNTELVARLGATAADSLMDFIRELRAVLTGRDPYTFFLDLEQRFVVEYYCAAMNNMTRCIDYTEEIRDRIATRCEQVTQSMIIEAYDRVIEGFYSIVALANEKLMAIVETDMRPMTALFYEPKSGTEVMLDALQTLDESFSDHQEYLMSRHFEELIVLCGQTMVAHYLEPFIQGRVLLKTSAVIAQIEKDTAHLTRFLQKHLISYQKKLLSYILQPVEMTQKLLLCKPNSNDMMVAFSTWKDALVMNKKTAMTLSGGLAVAQRLWLQRGIQSTIINDTMAVVKRSAAGHTSETAQTHSGTWRMRQQSGVK